MMKNIVTYVETQQQTFQEMSFNPVDSLILSTICYFRFETYEGIAPKTDERILLHDVLSLAEVNKLVANSWLADAADSVKFIAALRASRRFRDVSLAFFVNELSDKVEKQFSATSFFLSDDTVYLAFRGTDGSFAGWKEDFNLCFKSIIPSQSAATAYTSGIASHCTNALRLGGHSKGGNLAEYAALVVDESIFGRIVGIYNHDGPSFLDNPSPRMVDSRFKDKFSKTVPESSAFGMILERRSDYRVVQSSAASVFQHVPFTWSVEGTDFSYQGALNKSAAFFDSALDTWLSSKTPEDRERFIDTIYNLFVSTSAQTVPEFQTKLITNTKQVLGEGSRLDPETKRFIIQTVMALGGILRDKTFKRGGLISTTKTRIIAGKQLKRIG